VIYDEQINYLKSAEGNYLFDVKGNMFKTNQTEFDRLEEEGVICRPKNKRQNLSASSGTRVKKTHC
jgi:hypothetical protein